MEGYLQKFKQAEAEVVPSSSSVEVGLEVGVDYCPPLDQDSPKTLSKLEVQNFQSGPPCTHRDQVTNTVLSLALDMTSGYPLPVISMTTCIVSISLYYTMI